MKILIAVDFSECSTFALDSVRNQTWPKDTEFKLLHVVEPVYVSYGITGAYVQPMLDAHLEYVKNFRHIIEEKVTELRHDLPYCRVSGDVIEGSPATAIIDEAIDWKADQIVLGSHGRTGIQRFLLGSVAQRVAAHCPCSVSIVKPKKDKEADDKAKAKAEALKA